MNIPQLLLKCTSRLLQVQTAAGVPEAPSHKGSSRPQLGPCRLRTR